MIAALEQALALSPDNAPLRLQLAAMCANAERWPDAEAHYKHVLGNDPADQKAKLGLAKVFQRTDRLSAALVIYDELYDRGVRDPELLLALSRAGWLAMAVPRPDFGMASKARPDSWNASPAASERSVLPRVSAGPIAMERRVARPGSWARRVAAMVRAARRQYRGSSR